MNDNLNNEATTGMTWRVIGIFGGGLAAFSFYPFLVFASGKLKSQQPPC